MAFEINPSEDWRALAENYRSMSDEQLCDLAEDFADLTPTAQQVLRDEMKLRKLADPQTPGWQRMVPEPAHMAETGEAPVVEYTWKTPLCDCDSHEKAWQVGEMLRRAGIESWIEGPRTYARSSGSDHTGFEIGSQRVLVAADQLDEAQRIIERPVPADIVELSQMTPPEYEVPVCPRCGEAEPTLESVDPVNEWKCESCGAEWADEDPRDSLEG